MMDPVALTTAEIGDNDSSLIPNTSDDRVTDAPTLIGTTSSEIMSNEVVTAFCMELRLEAEYNVMEARNRPNLHVMAGKMATLGDGGEACER